MSYVVVVGAFEGRDRMALQKTVTARIFHMYMFSQKQGAHFFGSTASTVGKGG